MLQATVLKGVQTAKKALGDLAINCILKSRTPAAYVPGQPVSYNESSKTVKGVVTKYRKDEIDGTMIQSHDVLIILFLNDDLSGIPKLNDTVTANGVVYRVMSNNPMFAGSEIAFNMIQGRPV